MSKSFYDLLNEQIGHEFAASHQYLSMAIWLDGEDLPQLAKFFYRQSLEEREHALMMVQYKLDRGHKVEIPAVPAVKNDFENVQEIVDMSLAQEKVVTGQSRHMLSSSLCLPPSTTFCSAAPTVGTSNAPAPSQRFAAGGLAVR